MDLIEELAGFEKDPYGFVLWAFPWGEEGELKNAAGPEPWQKQILIDLGNGLTTAERAVRLARTSGHGIGKSACSAWIILWALSTFPDTVGVITANTETQLKTKSWAGLAKWYRLFLAKDLFRMTATGLFSIDPEHEKTWRIDMVPWSERNTEAFAGLHNQGRRLLLLFDEASAIPDVIWETSEGALTDKDTQIIWIAFGNPTRNTGRFKECFPGGRFAHRWNTDAIDSREVSLTDKDQIEQWIKDYGEDSDFVRVRVKGQFPRIDNESFIPLSLAYNAVGRVIEPQEGLPLILGVDVGRFGDDPSVIYPRRGRDGDCHPIEVFYGLDTMELAGKVAHTFNLHHADMIMVDSGGVGGGVADRLRELRFPVMMVDFGKPPDNTNPSDGTKYANKRAEIWGAMREWLKLAKIPERIRGMDNSFPQELATPNYGLNNAEAIQIESKKDMRRRGAKSPNVADALACTFAFPVFLRARDFEEDNVAFESHDYNPFQQEWMAI